MEIPYERLNPDVLAKIIEEFVLREGTDYGHTEFSLDAKVEQVRRQLQSKKVRVVFDPETETVSIETAGSRTDP